MKKFKEFVNEGVSYNYDVLIVLIEKDEDFSKEVQELCFSHDFKWYGSGGREYFSVSLNRYTIDIDLKDKLLILNPSINGEIDLSYWERNNKKVDPTIYTKSYFELLKNIFNYGYNRPSYKSRKFNKTYESIRYLMTPKSEEDIRKATKNMNSRDKLEHGAREGILWLVEYAINNGANILRYKNVALVTAAENGHTDIVKFLLNNGADIHYEEDVALRFASREGYSETVKFLLDNGADVHAYDDQALHWACALGNDVETVKILLDYGADMYAYDSAAIKSAAESNDEILDFLLNYDEEN